MNQQRVLLIALRDEETPDEEEVKKGIYKSRESDKLGCLWQRLFLIYSKLSITNNPLTPFIKGEFFKSPLEKGDRGGCLVCYATNFEIPVH